MKMFDLIFQRKMVFHSSKHQKSLKIPVQVFSIADFWSWLRLGFVGLIVKPNWQYSELAPEVLGGPLFESRSPPTEWLFAGYERPAPVRNDSQIWVDLKIFLFVFFNSHFFS